MWATVYGESVQMATLRPSRAAAYAASHPACPAPITMTSYLSATNVCLLHCNCAGCKSLPDAEPREDVPEHVVRRAFAGHFLERRAGFVHIGQHELFRDWRRSE